tara:strand:- start:8574 stop:9167 length:594 start_codon:yes stop_codon:yes gene_type:complete
MSLKYKELNEVSIFVLPFLALEPGILKGRVFNTYLGDDNIDSYKEGHIFLVHSNYQDKHFKLFEEILESNDHFVNSYDIVDSFFGVKVYKIPDDFREAYESFLKSKYSEYCKGSRGMCYRYNLLPESRILHHVFNKSEELRKKKSEYLGINLPENAELWSTWDKKLNYITDDLLQFLKSTLKKHKKISLNKDFLNEN